MAERPNQTITYHSPIGMAGEVTSRLATEADITSDVARGALGDNAKVVQVVEVSGGHWTDFSEQDSEKNGLTGRYTVYHPQQSLPTGNGWRSRSTEYEIKPDGSVDMRDNSSSTTINGFTFSDLDLSKSFDPQSFLGKLRTARLEGSVQMRESEEGQPYPVLRFVQVEPRSIYNLYESLRGLDFGNWRGQVPRLTELPQKTGLTSMKFPEINLNEFSKKPPYPYN